jgi:hypothetical protein
MATLHTAGKRMLQNDEKIIFYLILTINIAYLWYTRFYPTMDGPAHLYNANLIRHILLGNEFIKEFYQVNSFPVPNWTSHFLLSFFRLFTPGWISEKLFLMTYVAGMALSFRYLVKAIQPDNMSLSVFIFPFIYSFLFHIGFYNYTISFIFLFLTLGYWIRHYHENQLSLYLVTGALLILSYFSNILTYAFTGLTIGSIIFLFEAVTHPIVSKQYFLACFKRILRLTLCSLPSLIMVGWFFLTVSFPGTVQRYASSELLKWTNDVRSLIVFSYAKEEIITEQFFHLLLFLLLISFLVNRDLFSLKEKFAHPKMMVAYFPLVLAIIFLFALPDGSSAGMMSDRLSLMMYLFFVILIVSQPLPRRIKIIFSVLFISLHVILITKHSPTLLELNANAKTINETASHMEDNSIVLPVNLSDNWLQGHFSNYLGTDKPLVILENYEVNVGWFPLQWNANAPNILHGNLELVSSIEWPISHNKEPKQIDYIFLYGNCSKIEGEDWKKLKEIISANYNLFYESKNKYIRLYKIADLTLNKRK